MTEEPIYDYELYLEFLRCGSAATFVRSVRSRRDSRSRETAIRMIRYWRSQGFDLKQCWRGMLKYLLDPHHGPHATNPRWLK